MTLSSRNSVSQPLRRWATALLCLFVLAGQAVAAEHGAELDCDDGNCLLCQLPMADDEATINSAYLGYSVPGFSPVTLDRVTTEAQCPEQTAIRGPPSNS